MVYGNWFLLIMNGAVRILNFYVRYTYRIVNYFRKVHLPAMQHMLIVRAISGVNFLTKTL